jgi:hypothetical protein
MANLRAAQRPMATMASTTRTATTDWIGPKAACGTSFWWTSRRSFAVVLWRHVPTQHMSLCGERQEPCAKTRPFTLGRGVVLEHPNQQTDQA